jgi:DnaJ family protein C protein 9
MLDPFLQDSYRGSDEEKADVFKHYQKFKGNMEKVFEYVMCSDKDLDSHRFMDIVQAAAQEGGSDCYSGSGLCIR